MKFSHGPSLLAGITWILAMSSPGAAQQSVEVVLEAVLDNSIFEESDFSNGAGSHLFVGSTPGGHERRLLLKFDLSVLPVDARVTGASLTLTMTRTRHGATPVNLHRVLSSWGESTSDAGDRGGDGAPAGSGDATWRHRSFDYIAWASPGGDYVSAGSTVISVSDPGVYIWSGQGLVDDLNAWLSGSAENHGWIAITGGGAKRFTSRESSVVSERPRLSITYQSELPSPPSGLYLDSFSDTGIDSADRVTQDASPVLRGSSPEGSTVVVYSDGIEAARGQGGVGFSIPLMTLSDGVRTLTARTIGFRGAESVLSPPLEITIDTVAPMLVAFPDQGTADPSGTGTVAFLVGSDELVHGVTRGDFTIGGSSGPQVIRVTSEPPHDGKWHRVSVSGMRSEGTVSILLKRGAVTDRAGNVNPSESFAMVDFEKFGPDISTSFPLFFSGGASSVEGVAIPGDVDFFSFRVPEPARLRVELTNEVDLSGRLLDSDGRVIGTIGIGGKPVLERAVAPGRYFFEARSAEASVPGSYQIHLILAGRVKLQPDLLLGIDRSRMIGSGIYGSSRIQTVTIGLEHSPLIVSLENDGGAEDFIGLTGRGSRGAGMARWIIAGRNESAALLRGTFEVRLPVKGRLGIEVLLQPRPLVSGRTFSVIAKAVSSDRSKFDRVKFVRLADRESRTSMSRLDVRERLTRVFTGLSGGRHSHSDAAAEKGQ